MRVGVVGASGFIGRNLLLKMPHNWEVYGFYNTSRDFPSFLTRENLENVKPIKCDLSSEEDCESVLTGIEPMDVCIFLVANTQIYLSKKEPVQDLIMNTHTLINFLKNTKIDRFIFLSSGAVYDGHTGPVNPDVKILPTIPYAISKYASERYVHFFKERGGIDHYIIIRFYGAYGPYEPPRKIFSKLIRTFYYEKKKSFTIYGDGRNLIDAMYIEDAIDALMHVITKIDIKNITVDLCYGKPYTIIDLVRKVAEIVGIEGPVIETQGEAWEYNKFYSDPGKFEELFNYRPTTTLDEGIKKFIRWLDEKKVWCHSK